MPDIWFDVDTALAEVPVNIFPLTDDTDFKTIEGAVAYNAAGMALRWHFVTSAGAYTVTSVTPTTAGNYDWTDQGDSGIYTIEIPASGGASINNDTEGYGWFTGVATGVLPWRGPVCGFRAAALNDSLCDTNTTGLLAPTTAGRTLDVSAGGEAGVDWANVGTPGSTVSLSATTVATVTTATTATNVTTVNGLAANVITATSINADAITAAKIATGAIDADALATDAVTEITDATKAALGVVSGTADSGTTTTMVDAALTQADTDYWKGSTIVFTSGTISGQARLITGFTPASDTVTFAPATTQAVGTNTYIIVPAARVDVELWDGAAVNALASGRVDVTVGAMQADTLTSTAVASSAVTEMQAGLSTLDAAGIRSAVGLASANLDTQLGDIPTNAELTTAVANVSVDEIQATALADLFNTNSGTTYASAVAGSVVKEIADNAGGSALTEAGIADAVWDEVLAGHLTAGSTGAALNAAGSAGDPWATAIPGAYGAGTAGKILGDNINATISSRATQTSVDTVDDFLDTEIAAIKAKTDNLPASPAATGDIPTAATVADAVWDEDATGHQTQGTFGQAIGDPVADTNTIYKAVVSDAAGATVGLDVVAVKAETASILADTAEIGAAGAGLTEAGGTGDHLTAVPWNAAWDAQVESEVADALAVYDPPTKAELDAAAGAVVVATGGISAASLAAAALNAVADATLDRNMAAGTDSGTNNTSVRTPRQALRALRNKVTIAAGTATVTKEDDSTTSWTASVSTAAGDPLTGVDPA